MLLNTLCFVSRGGVEDTRLEAKAKETKKIQGQGQPFRGQTLSRPRTGRLEAKAKDQGHKCFPKKKRSSKFFSGNLKKRSSKIFFRRSPVKNIFRNFFQAIAKFQQFKKKCCPRAEVRAIFEDLRFRGQGQGLDLRGQGQGLQNESSRTPPLFVSLPVGQVKPRNNLP